MDRTGIVLLCNEEEAVEALDRVVHESHSFPQFHYDLVLPDDDSARRYHMRSGDRAVSNGPPRPCDLAVPQPCVDAGKGTRPALGRWAGAVYHGRRSAERLRPSNCGLSNFPV